MCATIVECQSKEYVPRIDSIAMTSYDEEKFEAQGQVYLIVGAHRKRLDGGRTVGEFSDWAGNISKHAIKETTIYRLRLLYTLPVKSIELDIYGSSGFHLELCTMNHASAFSADDLSHSHTLITSIWDPISRQLGPEHKKDRKNALKFWNEVERCGDQKASILSW